MSAPGTAREERQAMEFHVSPQVLHVFVDFITANVVTGAVEFTLEALGKMSDVSAY